MTCSRRRPFPARAGNGKGASDGKAEPSCAPRLPLTPRPGKTNGPKTRARCACPGSVGRPWTAGTTCAGQDRHCPRRMATASRGHGEEIVSPRRRRAGFGVLGGLGRWARHTGVRADASGPLSGSDRCVAPGSDPARGSTSVEFRTVSGPAFPPKPRQALLAPVSDALPLYPRQTKNLLVPYSPKMLGSFQPRQKDARLVLGPASPAARVGRLRSPGRFPARDP